MAGYIIYGRLKSTRLPKKALLKINGKSLIRIFIERISLSSQIDKIVFATSDLVEDRPLAELAKSEGLEVYCGEAEDVAVRLYKTAQKFNFDYFLTTMIDGPFQFAEVLDETIKKLITEKYDMLYSYPSQPNGTDCYGIATAALKKVIDLKKTEFTECWGKYFTETGFFKCGEVNLFANHSHLKDFRLTLDYPEDYEFCQELYQDLLSTYGLSFSLTNMIAVLSWEKYQNQLAQTKTLSAKWETHFSSSSSEVDSDIRRVIQER